MTAMEARFRDIYRGMRPKERVAAFLKALHADDRPDPRLRDSTPDHQISECNDLITLANGAHTTAGWYSLWLRSRAEQLQERCMYLDAMKLWALTVREVRMYRTFASAEPVTESEYAEKGAEARAELIPLWELASELAWVDADRDEGMTERQFKAREKVHEAAIRDAVAKGELPAIKKGKDLQVARGAFCDWRGVETPVHPEYATRYEVLPDAQRARAQQDREWWERADQALRWAPGQTKPDGSPSSWDEPLEAMKDSVVAQLAEMWMELLAVERAVAEVQDALDGTVDPLHPVVRGWLVEARETMTAVKVRLLEIDRDVEFAMEPPEELMNAVRGNIRR